MYQSYNIKDPFFHLSELFIGSHFSQNNKWVADGVACPGTPQKTRNILFHRQGTFYPQRITAYIVSIISTGIAHEKRKGDSSLVKTK